MVLDTSAIVAILLGEDDSAPLLTALLADKTRLISTGTMFEASIVLATRRGELSVDVLDRFIRQAEIEIVPFDERQLDAARTAWRRFGKGRRRASLNFGDCFAYALAKTRDEALLFKGANFGHTDIDRVSLTT
jgi:ribonuclease VapC